MTHEEITKGIERLAGGFMKPAIWRGNVWEVSADHGSTFYVDAGVAGIGKDKAVPDNIQDYVEGTIDTDDNDQPIVTLRENVWIAQLSAPGYMDQTDLTIHETELKAAEYLVETYDDSEEV